MRRSTVLAIAALAGAAGHAQAATRTPVIRLQLDSSEADQAIVILEREHSGRPVAEQDWKRLFATAPYRVLKAREASMGRSFTDDQFKAFLSSRDALAQLGTWKRTVAGMKSADMAAIGKHVLNWLPAGATLRAKVFPEIKPLQNSFVWKEQPSDPPAIFLAVQKQSRDSFENTVAHELHHIGLDSLEARQEALQAGLPAQVKLAVKWMGAFGEGEAMLAAAGSDDRHPHWEDDSLARARWDSDMMHFNADLDSVQDLLLDILDGKLTTDDEIQKRAAPFWGYQGAWYTVGYEMAALVDKRFGRKSFDECLLDPRLLLERYNEVAKEANAKGASLATWSPELMRKLRLR
ncbi:MAG TPA: DUF5700 domain-containing putative Zn-dependent protease [Sphingomicrobium sp.]|nr:DUF5700 domain-containing putative Zn-dependent protease [Sphingomicrobium sp.]